MAKNNSKKVYQEKSKMENIQSTFEERVEKALAKASFNNDNTSIVNNKLKQENNLLSSIRLNNKNLMEAIVYSEILGKPRCKQRGRWR